MTQAEVARLVDVAPNTVTRWESGNRRPSIDLLEKLADLYKCRVRDLLPERRANK